MYMYISMVRLPYFDLYLAVQTYNAAFSCLGMFLTLKFNFMNLQLSEPAGLVKTTDGNHISSRTMFELCSSMMAM